MALTDVQWVRYRIGDTAEPHHFNDAELSAYLEIEEGDRLMAAAAALDAWATSLAANAHDIMLGDYRENTAAAANAMRQSAASLREEAKSTPALAIAQGHTGPGSDNWRTILTNRALRGELP